VQHRDKTHLDEGFQRGRGERQRRVRSKDLQGQAGASSQSVRLDRSADESWVEEVYASLGLGPVVERDAQPRLLELAGPDRVYDALYVRRTLGRALSRRRTP
jgi:hypothetical protein